jgi:phospholipid/cholesterol/gamma-HCH transport system permease protein
MGIILDIKNSFVNGFLGKISTLQDYTLLLVDIFKGFPTIKKYRTDTLKEMYVIGTKALPLVTLGGLFVGIILAIEAGHNLEMFGATTLIGHTVSLGMIRELGPVITGLLLASRTGAKNTSEIGAMQLSEQIDALRAFGLSPVDKLVIPRLVAAMIMFLPLTLIADIAGIIGGMYATNSTFHVDYAFFWDSALKVLKMKDIFIGCIKPIFFAFFISSISCYYGLSTKSSTTDLGKKSINAVVVSAIVVLALDFIFTKVVWEIM